jgi:outer membrane lipoprotein-sorting protein
MKNRSTTTIILLAGLLMLFSLPTAYTQQTSAPSVQQIFEQMIAAYASCQSYMDTGRVHTVFLEKRGRRTVVKPFSTAFVRPDAFRFEFQDRRGEEEWEHYIVWQQGAAVKSFWTVTQQQREHEQLSSALGTAAGVSSLSSTTIPALLMPDSVRGGRFKSLTGLKLLGEEQVEQRAAYKLEGQDARGTPLTLWLDKERLLVLKTFQKNRIEPRDGRESFETETTTFYDAQINEKVPAARLEFMAVMTK